MTDAAQAPDAPIGHNAPPKRARVCAECGATFRPTGRALLFCSDAHKAAFHNRSSKIGRLLVPLAMAWRAGRNVKGSTPEALAMKATASRAFDELCRALDRAVTEDRESGRLPKLNYLRRRWSIEGTLSPAETVAYHEKELARAKRRLAAEGKALKAAAAAQPEEG